MTCGYFGSTADKVSEVDCSHKVNSTVAFDASGSGPGHGVGHGRVPR
jgi:hypothetical protein